MQEDNGEKEKRPIYRLSFVIAQEVGRGIKRTLSVMKMTESSLWKKLNKLMGDSWDAKRHEDILQKGVPDVSYSINPQVSGWIELKCEFSIPQGALSLKMKTLTQDQRVWLYNRQKYNGHCFVLCANEKNWIFVNASLVIYSEVSLSLVSMRRSNEVDQSWIQSVLEGKVGYRSR